MTINRIRILALCSILLLPFSQSAQAMDGKLTVGTGLEYTSGEYGTGATTEIWTLPVSLSYQTGPWFFRLGTSWLYVSGPGDVNAEGEPTDDDDVTKPKRTTEQGMGDVTATITYNLVDENKQAFGLDIGAKIKFGTADEKKFLGTGENDYSLQAEILKPVGAWTPHLTVGYRWKGDPAGVDYHDIWYASAGASYRFSKTLSTGFVYDWHEKLTASSSEQSEATLNLNYRFNEVNRIGFYFIKGFSDASPDWGAGATLSHSF